VENLDYGVSDQDMQELFGTFGPLKFARVNYDHSGRSLGTAEVQFVHAQAAAQAVSEYNGIDLDGRPMRISTFGGEPRFQQRQTRQVVERQGNRNGNRQAGKQRQKQKRPQKQKAPAPKSLESLDAELNAFAGVDALDAQMDQFQQGMGDGDANGEANGDANGDDGNDVNLVE
jgi:THO complex subunit 4